MGLKSRAMDTLESARDSLEKGRFWLACLSAHQAVEFHLNEILLDLAGAYMFTHDLRVLLGSLGEDATDQILEVLDYLNPHYTASLHSLSMDYRERTARRCLEYADRVIGWMREGLGR